jgi:YidC/Oxa1 family membrane protein insertase
MKTTRAMQEMQPKLLELQKKYAHDKQRLAREQMALYKDAGASPLGCAVPLLIQLPIMIALYQAITRILATFPDDFLGLSQYLYPVSIIYSKLPLESNFLWLNLSLPDQYYIMPILTGITMWVQQKQISVASPDPQQQSQQKIMLWTMPFLFVYISLSFPSGLGLYWVLSSVIGVLTQYVSSGWGGLADLKDMRLRLPWGGGASAFKKPAKRQAKTQISTPKAPAVEKVNSETSSELDTEGSNGVTEEKSEQTQAIDQPKGPGAPRPNPRKYKSHRRGK